MLLEFSSSCVGFFKKKTFEIFKQFCGFFSKKRKEKTILSKVLFQDKLERNEQKIRFFPRKSF